MLNELKIARLVLFTGEGPHGLAHTLWTLLSITKPDNNFQCLASKKTQKNKLQNLLTTKHPKKLNDNQSLIQLYKS